MREITVKYEGECSACGAVLELGTRAMYEKTTGIFCVGCEPTDPEKIRKFRTIKAEYRASRKIGKAERLEREAASRVKPYERLRGDYAFITQPGHIPERARMIKAEDKAFEMLREAKEARQQAEGIMCYKTRVAGDAERKRQALRDQLDSIIHKGARVRDAVFGFGEVVGVFKKSYRIKFDGGFTYARDKSFIRPIAENEGREKP